MGYLKVLYLRSEREERLWVKVESGTEERDGGEKTGRVCSGGKKRWVGLRCLVWAREGQSLHGLGMGRVWIEEVWAGGSHSWYGPVYLRAVWERMGRVWTEEQMEK